MCGTPCVLGGWVCSRVLTTSNGVTSVTKIWSEMIRSRYERERQTCYGSQRRTDSRSDELGLKRFHEGTVTGVERERERGIR